MGSVRRSSHPIRAIPALILLALVTAGPESRAAGTQTLPNFVVIVLDDAGWNDFGAYGNPGVRTPSIDRLAAEGMRFDNAFVTTSSCSPSRASLMTGRYPHNTGAQVLESPLPASAVVFPTALAKAGYYTAAAGKWHLGDPTKAKIEKLYPVTDNSGTADWVRALAERPRDRPFLLWLASTDPHREWTAPRRHRPEDVVVPPFLADRPRTRSELARYYDEIARADQVVGQVLDQLSEQGVAANTFVVLLSDNGSPFPRCKTSLYDSGVKTPFIVRWPSRVKAGSINPNLISSIDLAPTILELAGIESPPEFEGRSFARTLFDPAVSIRDTVFLERNTHGLFGFERGVRSLDFLYIQNLFPTKLPCHLQYRTDDATKDLMDLVREKSLSPAQSQCFASPRPLEELYDTHSDPFSLRNLAGEPAHAQVLAKMRAVLATWSAETGDAIDLEHCGGRLEIPCADRPEVMRRKARLEAMLARQSDSR